MAERSLGSLNLPETDIPLSDQARRAAEARVDWIEWALGLERMTQEQAERVASFRRMDAALISARGKMPYLNTLLELRASDRAIDMRVTMELNSEVKQT